MADTEEVSPRDGQEDRRVMPCCPTLPALVELCAVDDEAMDGGLWRNRMLIVLLFRLFSEFKQLLHRQLLSLGRSTRFIHIDQLYESATPILP